MFFVILLLISVSVLSESCPYLENTYAKSQQLFASLNNVEYQIFDDGIDVSIEQATSVLLVPIKPEIIALYNKSTILLQTEQLYSELFISNSTTLPISNDEKLDILRSCTTFLPQEDLCQASVTCDDDIYRSSDGRCNNLQSPLSGSSHSPFSRITNSFYNDAIHRVRKNTVTNEELISPRTVLNGVLPVTSALPSQIANYGGITFGQNMAHDMGQRELIQDVNGGVSFQCCSSDLSRELPHSLQGYGCYPINIPTNDPFFAPLNMTCMNYLRSQPILPLDCNLGTAQLSNTITSYFDQSMVYGNDLDTANNMRTFVSGQMKMDSANILPLIPNCEGACYLVADSRSAQHATIAVIVSISLRLHNKIASELSVINPNWNDETLYQEARRLSNAIYQNAIYTQWIPIYLGTEISEEYGLICPDSATYCGNYNSSILPGTANEFAHGTFRVFHKLLPAQVQLINSSLDVYQQYNLSDLINRAYILNEDTYDGFLNGMIYQPVNFKYENLEVSNRIFKNNNVFGVGDDVIAHDIQRGRDHGIAPYYIYQQMCLPDSPKVNSWEDIEITIPKENINQLKKYYSSVKDVDMFIGLMLEKKSNQYFGVVSRCLMALQFYTSKYSDRFFYSFPDSGYPFTEAQMNIINGYTYANILCDNTDLDKVALNPFMLPNPENPVVDCSTLSTINLSAWQA